MPKPRLPYVELNPNRHGRPRYYFRRDRGTERVRLPDAYGSLDFHAAYQACLAGQPLPLLPGQTVRRASRGTLGWLINLYLDSAEFGADAPATQRIRRAMLNRLIETKGGVPIERIDRTSIADGLKERAATPAMANAWLIAVRNLFDWARQEPLPSGDGGPIWDDENPCALVKRLQKPRTALDEEDGHPTWSEEDLARFEAAYAPGTRERLAYEVFFGTGLRLGDAARLGRQHVRNGVIRIKTEKTTTPVSLRVTPRLQQALEAGPRGSPEELAFITGANGRAMEKTYLGKWFGQQCRAIGVERSAHGLRKAAARRYAEQGATTKQLQARFGWATVSMAEKYTCMADREKLSLDLDDEAVA